ncbi:protein Osi24 [Rhynchophorus ferrugineus]|uniref:protein Osi24 n=1 Tax=Rhynchophorus ferrugineus TaxID=354439 RepID=UPI003FCE3D40
MPKLKTRTQSYYLIELVLICSIAIQAQACSSGVQNSSSLESEIKQYVDSVLQTKTFPIIPGVQIESVNNVTVPDKNETCENGRSSESMEGYLSERLSKFVDTHVISVNLDQTARFLSSNPPDGAAAAAATTVADTSGKSSFLAGFGMGMLAFLLKKMLLPVFIGAQFIKSILIAMFLPTILGGVGKLVGKGLSTFSGLSSASTGLNRPQPEIEDFEFKDVDPYNNEAALDAGFDDGDNMGLNTIDSSSTSSPNSRHDFAHNRIYTSPTLNDNYYLQRPKKKTNFKIFHKIPSSSMLLTSYDPFYSPLLSRLDAVFQQMGLGNEKSPQTERCRERLICMMYANPAKYAPYSNLVSAQLSRELNELRKPSSDNPDILRFFRYMKAAKDGQDGEECLAHNACPQLSASPASPALLTTYNEINKLVQARKLHT